MEISTDYDKELFNPAFEEFSVTLLPISGHFDNKHIKLKIQGNKKILDVQKRIRKKFELKDDETVYIFLADTFLVSPSESLFDLKTRFGSGDGSLTLKFSLVHNYGY